MNETSHDETARALIACIDLTDLSDDCTEADIDALVERATTPHGTVAAICIYPRFVRHARQALPAGVRLATVVNFPAGADDVEATIAETRQAVADGADEIDLVISHDRVEEDPGFVAEQVRRVKEAAGSATLKTILETGELRDPGLVEMAAVASLKGGTDFLKTSTGKTATGASLPAARILLNQIAQIDRPVGLKPSGGIRTFEDAKRYLDLTVEIMGEGWARPQTFRLGASGLLTDLLAVADGTRRPDVADAY